MVDPARKPPELQRLVERRAELLELAAARSRRGVRTRAAALRLGLWPIVQTALAASLAWLVATELVGHREPFFAPVAACIVIGVTVGQHASRTVEICVGVAVGVLVADVLVSVTDTGTVQLATVILVAMVAAVLLGGGGQLLVTQAATTAALVATIESPAGGGLSLDRFVDSLVGGGMGIAIALLLPVDPLLRVQRGVSPVFAALAAALRDIAVALRERDHIAADAALERAREVDDTVSQARAVLAETRDVVRFAPGRQRTRQRVERWTHALLQLDLAARNTRVLARGARGAIDLEHNVPSGAYEALERLAASVEALQTALHSRDPIEREAALDAAVEHAREAAAAASEVLELTGNMSISMIVGQIRSTAVDLLRGVGMGRDTATHEVTQAAKRRPHAR